MTKQHIFKPNLAWSAGNYIAETMPKAKISKIIIKHNVGTPGAGSYVANTAIEDIVLRINEKEFINWGGTKGVAGAMSYGIRALREFYLQKHRIAMTDEYFEVELPDALPLGAHIDLKVEMASLASMGITVSYDGTFDIIYETEDKIPGKTVIPYICWGEWAHGADTGKLVEYLTTLSYRLRMLIFITEDGNTLANDTYDTLTVSFPTEPIFEGAMASWRAHWQRKSHIALSTGFFALAFKGGKRIPANTFKFEFYAETAGTAKKVHWYAICY